ncbi:MAG: molecular chaperone TorD family protein [Chloroflexota bacterium]|nr:molecular chaperone TorD family protein [Chloroflexota bacterium]
MRGMRETLRAVFPGLASTDRELEAMELALAGLPSGTGLAVEYTRVFVGPERAEAYPYESMYRDGEIMGQTTRQVAACYERAGLAVSAAFKDLPDHITAELEFMACLCVQELNARQQGDGKKSARFRREREAFLEEHLAMWVPMFAERVTTRCTSPFYRGLARLLREVTAASASKVARREKSSTAP